MIVYTVTSTVSERLPLSAVVAFVVTRLNTHYSGQTSSSLPSSTRSWSAFVRGDRRLSTTCTPLASSIDTMSNDEGTLNFTANISDNYLIPVTSDKERIICPP